MTAASELTVKESFQDCKMFECPRFLAICKQKEDGSYYFSEGDIAYQAATLCNNWAIGLSDGECVVNPTVLEGAQNA